MDRIGFIGLGVMGQPMAMHLGEKIIPMGKDLLLFDLDRSRAEGVLSHLGQGEGKRIRIARDLADFSETELIFLSLPVSSIVKETVLNLVQPVRPNCIIVDTSTTEVETVKALAEDLSNRGIDFFDAPVSGGEKAAKEGTLSFMVGGREESFTLIQPFLLAMGASAVYMGGPGAGQTAKAVNQIIVGAAFTAIAESFSLGVQCGLDPRTLYDAIKGGWAGSKVLDVAAQDMLDRSFKPGGTVDIHWKDLGYALSLAKDTDTPVPLTALVHEVFKAARAKGEGQKSQSAVVRLWEDLLNIEVK